MKERKRNGAAGEGIKCLSWAGSTKCGVMLGLQPRPSFPRKFLAPRPYHSAFRRAPIAPVSHEDKYGKNFSPSPTLPGSAAASSRLGSSHPPLQGISPSPSHSPNLSTFKVLQQMTCAAFPCSKWGWHNSRCGWFSSLPAPGKLDPNPAASQHWRGSLSRILSPPDSGWLNPGMNLCVLSKQVEKRKRCQEALAGLQPSGNSGQAIARKYISRRVPPPRPPAPTLAAWTACCR